MITRQSLIAVLAAAAAVQRAAAFAPSAHNALHLRVHRTTSLASAAASSHDADVELTRKAIMDHVETSDQIAEAYQIAAEAAVEAQEKAKLIMDIPPMPVASKAAPKATKAAPKKKGGNPHKEGVFSPIVVAAGAVLGEEQLNKVRGKVIAIHSDLIKSFVDTSDSAFGKTVLTQLFKLVDTDNSGYLDKSEVAVALNLLGFKWLGEKQVGKIFERADANGDLEISLEEFINEAPKTLRTNLVKLAKTNGGEMGLLV
ncbi:hypothetical protein ACHAXT_007659 [Thalassiosira profunda]